MPKPVNHSIGKCLCRVRDCTAAADIRQVKGHGRGALYLNCPVHGRDLPLGAGPMAELQDWIIEHAIAEGPEPGPEQGQGGASAGPAPAGEDEPAAAGAGLERGRGVMGWFSSANEQLNEWMGGKP